MTLNQKRNFNDIYLSISDTIQKGITQINDEDKKYNNILNNASTTREENIGGIQRKFGETLNKLRKLKDACKKYTGNYLEDYNNNELENLGLKVKFGTIQSSSFDLVPIKDGKLFGGNSTLQFEAALNKIDEAILNFPYYIEADLNQKIQEMQVQPNGTDEYIIRASVAPIMNICLTYINQKKDELSKNLDSNVSELPPGWNKHWDDQYKRHYYTGFDKSTNQNVTQWESPSKKQYQDPTQTQGYSLFSSSSNSSNTVPGGSKKRKTKKLKKSKKSKKIKKSKKSRKSKTFSKSKK